MPQPLSSPGVSIISEMITPALLILASGSLLGTVLARLGRVVENLRRIGDVVGKGEPSPAQEQILAHLTRRVDLAEAAVLTCYLAVTLFVLTCLLIAIDRLADHRIYWAPVASAIVGISLLLIGSGYMVAECRTAVRQIRHEVETFKSRFETD